jgi:hypothetical protein
MSHSRSKFTSSCIVSTYFSFIYIIPSLLQFIVPSVLPVAGQLRGTITCCRSVVVFNDGGRAVALYVTSLYMCVQFLLQICVVGIFWGFAD